MIVNDFNVLGSLVGPTKTNSILIVDSNGVLPCSVSLQLFESQARKGEGFQRYGGTQLVERSTRPVVEVRGECLPCSFRVRAVEDVGGTLVLEGDNQPPPSLLGLHINA